MKQLTVEDLRALIRLIPAARALHEEVEKSIHLEMSEGTGDLVVRSYHGLQEAVYAITEDPYVQALSLNVSESTPERHIIAQAMLASSQLIAYIEGQTGIAGLTGKQKYSIQTAPTITLNMDGFSGGPIETERIMETIDRAIRYRPAPPFPTIPPISPIPPTPPAPPRPGRPDWLHDPDDI